MVSPREVKAGDTDERFDLVAQVRGFAGAGQAVLIGDERAVRLFEGRVRMAEGELASHSEPELSAEQRLSRVKQVLSELRAVLLQSEQADLNQASGHILSCKTGDGVVS